MTSLSRLFAALPTWAGTLPCRLWCVVMASRDAWLAEFDEARRLADDAFVLLNERRDQLQQSADASVARLTAASRRKLNALSSKVASLEAALGDDNQSVSAKERDRRRDMIARLRTHSAQLTDLLSRKDAPARALTGGAGAAAEERPRETLETAERDELGLLVLQRDVLAAQNTQLDDLSRTVTSVRHIACAVNEELDLQSRLLVRRGTRSARHGACAAPRVLATRALSCVAWPVGTSTRTLRGAAACGGWHTGTAF